MQFITDFYNELFEGSSNKDDVNKSKKDDHLFNDQSADGCDIATLCGYYLCCLTAGHYPYYCKRRVVGPDKMGHYVRNGKHYYVGSGVYTLMPINAKWMDDKPMQRY